MIHFTNYKKSYGDFLALKIDDLQIDSGLFWIKGENGSGKSTLLKTIAGILSFDGSIILNNSINLKKQTVSYRMLVNFADAEPLFPEFLTGSEMINLFVQAKNAPSDQERYYIESMYMNSYIDRPIGTYSSGMLKKLSLVLAFIGRPSIILLDEPLITLDNDSMKILYKWISEKSVMEGTSFFLSSHQELRPENLFSVREILVETQTIKFIN